MSKALDKIRAATEAKMSEVTLVDGKTRKCSMRVMFSNLDAIKAAIEAEGRDKVTEVLTDIAQERIVELIDDEVNS